MAKTATQEPTEGQTDLSGFGDAAENTLISIGDDGSIGLNFKEAPSMFDPIDNGKYPALVTGSTLKKVRSGTRAGAPMVAIKFTIQDAEGPLQGRNVWRNYILTPDLMGFFKQFLMRTGQYAEEELANPNFRYEPNEIMGAPVVVEVEQRKWTNDAGEEQISNDVKNVFADDGSSDWS
jgi:hypothetical protein